MDSMFLPGKRGEAGSAAQPFPEDPGIRVAVSSSISSGYAEMADALVSLRSLYTDAAAYDNKQAFRCRQALDLIEELGGSRLGRVSQIDPSDANAEKMAWLLAFRKASMIVFFIAVGYAVGKSKLGVRTKGLKLFEAVGRGLMVALPFEDAKTGLFDAWADVQDEIFARMINEHGRRDALLDAHGEEGRRVLAAVLATLCEGYSSRCSD